jgi:hypothetical protein
MTWQPLLIANAALPSVLSMSTIRMRSRGQSIEGRVLAIKFDIAAHGDSDHYSILEMTRWL